MASACMPLLHLSVTAVIQSVMTVTAHLRRCGPSRRWPSSNQDWCPCLTDARSGLPATPPADTRGEVDPPTGTVEVDETVVGGPRPGTRGRGAKGKVKVAVAIELLDPKGYGRCRLCVIPDYSSKTLHRFICDNIEPGATVITDELASYNGVEHLGYTAYNISKSSEKSHELMPAVNRVCANLKRWLTGTRGAPSPACTCSPTSTSSASGGTASAPSTGGCSSTRLMECAVSTPPLRYEDLAKIRRPKPDGKKPSLPGTRFLGRREARNRRRSSVAGGPVVVSAGRAVSDWMALMPKVGPLIEWCLPHGPATRTHVRRKSVRPRRSGRSSDQKTAVLLGDLSKDLRR
jgi:transposase-like protein